MSYSVKGIGVVGEFSNQRTSSDQKMISEFPMRNTSQIITKGTGIGIIGEDGPQRSYTDIKMAQEFHPNQENFQYRTQYDRNMQQTFNPYYSQNREDFCGNGGAGNTHAEDPYNPYSNRASYIGID